MRFHLAFILVLITCAKCYSIQGNWTLVSAQGISLGTESVVLGITDFIYQKQQILQKLAFVGCKQLLLQAEFSQDQLFINANSYFTQPLDNLTCGQQNVLDQIYSRLSQVFFFEINIDQLLFNDPYGNSVMTFKRLVINNPLNITGIWNMNQYANTVTSLSVQISPKQITLCQGNLIYNYSFIQAENVANLKPVLSNCPSQDLTAALESTKYFRINNGILNFYDKTVSLSVELVYSTAYDPAKPLFAAPVSPSTSNQQTSAVSVSNLVGRWSIASLFNVPFPTTPYSLTFTASSIQLNGGCNSYTFPYTLNSTVQIITIGNSSSTSKSCGQSDDQLFASGVAKMYKYLLSNANGVTSLNCYDQSGAIGYSLQINENPQPIQQSPISTPTRVATTASTSIPLPPLSPGTYLLLLLSRRDLPRLLVTITSNKITYQGCNSITQTFTPANLSASQSSITFAGGPTTFNKCTINNDLTYYSTLNQAKAYSYDSNAGAVILTDSTGAQIVTLSRASR